MGLNRSRIRKPARLSRADGARLQALTRLEKIADTMAIAAGVQGWKQRDKAPDRGRRIDPNSPEGKAIAERLNLCTPRK